MASNKTTLADRDGDFSNWIERSTIQILNLSVSAGWYLTDNASNKTKWQFPAVSIPAQGYLVVFASDKNRRYPGAELHTNFALSADGEYLGLIRPDGATVESEFATAYSPAPAADVAYGLGRDGETQRLGFLRTPTPGASNSAVGLGERVQISPVSRTFVAPLQITLMADAIAGQVIRFDRLPRLRRLACQGRSRPQFPPIYRSDCDYILHAYSCAVFSEDGSVRGASSSRPACATRRKWRLHIFESSAARAPGHPRVGLTRITAKGRSGFSSSHQASMIPRC